ncbi:hypothetical protein MKZ38_008806 [Zalerion maritima]|uniref:3CxxC-type domain-containing protein n=1 Tax=Zalerion maritima TaxID=339359 RepID=A0AAD5RKJ8_9PEZI|nr:hypothetical protein MKZ38_008806 [Zalerion maritima]
MASPPKMAKRKASKPKGEARTSFKYPSFHEDVSKAVSHSIASAWFNKNGSDKSSNNKYSTNVMGKFRCSRNCRSGAHWSSKKVAILIRGYPGNGYDAVVFNQRCKSCDGLGALTLDQQSYVERVSYRLRKWAGVRVENQPYDGTKGLLPHKSELCEGCKRGYCKQGKNSFGE